MGDLKALNNHSCGEPPFTVGKDSDPKETISCPTSPLRFSQRERWRKKKKRIRKKKPRLCKLSVLSRCLIFLQARLVRLLRPRFLFMSSLWFRNRQFWVVCFLMPIAQVILHSHPLRSINGAYSEVKISWEPIFK